MVYLFIGIKFCITLRSSDPFFFGGNLVRASQGLLRLPIISVSSIAEKIVFAKLRSFVEYLSDFSFTE